MSHLKHIPGVAVSALLVLGGLGAALTGVYLLTGLPATLIVGGIAATAAGLIVDLG